MPLDRCSRCDGFIFESSKHICPCPVCGESRYEWRKHRCAPKWDVMLEDHDPDDFRPVFCHGSANSAAEAFVHRYDFYGGDGASRELVVFIRLSDTDDPWQRLIVTSELTVIYHAREDPNGPGPSLSEEKG